jgi:hypothetical protein
MSAFEFSFRDVSHPRIALLCKAVAALLLAGCEGQVDPLAFDSEAFITEFDVQGKVRGEALSPLYKSVPTAAQKDKKLYECLALVDAIRAGRARERKLVETLLRERIGS